MHEIAVTTEDAAGTQANNASRLKESMKIRLDAKTTS